MTKEEEGQEVMSPAQLHGSWFAYVRQEGNAEDLGYNGCSSQNMHSWMQ